MAKREMPTTKDVVEEKEVKVEKKEVAKETKSEKRNKIAKGY